jgi:hypothetical protein
VARFHCEVLNERGERVCAGMIDVRNRRARGGIPAWDGHFVSFDDTTTVFSLVPGEYVLRLRDGSEHAALLNQITLGTSGPYVGFVGARGSGPGTIPDHL